MSISEHSGRLNCNAGIAGRCIVCHYTGIDTMVRVETPSSTDTNTMVRAKIESERMRKQDTGDYKEVKKKDNAKRCKDIRSIKDKTVESKDPHQERTGVGPDVDLALALLYLTELLANI